MDDQKQFSKTFTLTAPDAIEIEYIMRRNHDSAVFLHKLLVWAKNLEDIYCRKPAPEE